MNNNKNIPSTINLVKPTVIAVITAIFLLVVVVLPAEYGVDITGAGDFTGLKKMGEIKVSLALELVEEERFASERADQIEVLAIQGQRVKVQEALQAQMKSLISTDEVKFTLGVNESMEIKLKMIKGAEAFFEWQSDGGAVNYDMHADSKKLNIKYHPYNKGSKKTEKGVIQADFNGKHGWFWRNRSGKPVNIILKTKGAYIDIMEVK